MDALLSSHPITCASTIKLKLENYGVKAKDCMNEKALSVSEIKGAWRFWVFAGKVRFVTSTKGRREFLASNVCYPFASSLVLPARESNEDTLLSIFLSFLYNFSQNVKQKNFWELSAPL
jgi:hypothetical protein